MPRIEATQLDFVLEIHLDRLVRFHNVLRQLMRSEYQTAKESADANAISELTIFDVLHSTNAFLAFYSYAEEMLYQMTEHVLPSVASSNGIGIGRFKDALKNIGIDLSASIEWTFFMDASTIRDCLLHANGRVSFVRSNKQTELKRVLTKYANELRVESDCVRVRPEFTKRYVDSIRAFRLTHLAASGH